jgi:hypothetical protein
LLVILNRVVYALHQLPVKIIYAIIGVLIPDRIFAALILIITLVRLEKTCNAPLGAMLSLPAGLGPTGARATGVEEQPTNNETKPAPINMHTLFIILHFIQLRTIQSTL